MVDIRGLMGSVVVSCADNVGYGRIVVAHHPHFCAFARIVSGSLGWFI